MKPLIVLFLCAFLSSGVKAQLVVNSSNSIFDSIVLQEVDTTNFEYFKAILIERGLRRKLVCEIYLGKPKGFLKRRNFLRNEEKDVLKFHSDLEIMNLLYKNGWEFTYAMRGAYLFRRIRS